MEGRVCEVDTEKGYGYIDTQNRSLGRLRFYLQPIRFPVKVDDTVSFSTKTSAAGNVYAVEVQPVERNQLKSFAHSTEDKLSWCKEGERLEICFLEYIAPVCPGLILNPEKETNPYAIDFYDTVTHRYADLKTQNTPFFTASARKYQIQQVVLDPRRTVTFNRKDYLNYKRNHPDCDIYWSVEWKQLTFQDRCIEPLSGVWVSPFQAIAKKIESGLVPLHAYQHRVDDDRNARDSYLLDLRDKTVFRQLI